MHYTAMITPWPRGHPRCQLIPANKHLRNTINRGSSKLPIKSLVGARESELSAPAISKCIPNLFPVLWNIKIGIWSRILCLGFSQHDICNHNPQCFANHWLESIPGKQDLNLDIWRRVFGRKLGWGENVVKKLRLSWTRATGTLRPNEGSWTQRSTEEGGSDKKETCKAHLDSLIRMRMKSSSSLSLFSYGS